MSALVALTRTQFKVFLREPLAVFFGLAFPTVLLVVIGVAYPGATDPEPTFGGRSLVEAYAPTTVVLGLATMAVFLLPVALGGDRERGILRRLSTTPAHPGTLVTAHLAVQLVIVTLATTDPRHRRPTPARASACCCTSRCCSSPGCTSPST